MSDKYVQFYKDRKTKLKEVRGMANRFLKENIALKPHLHTAWERDRVETNIARLKEIISGINKDLTDEAVRTHVVLDLAELRSKGKKKVLLFGKNILKGFKEWKLLFDIAKHSVSYSIDNDFYWIKDGKMKDHFEVALGIRDPDTFGVYCEEKIIFIQQHVVPYLTSSSTYNCDLLSSILSDFKHQQYANSNILIIVVIEGMTREMCKQLYMWQNPNMKREQAEEFVGNYQSLEMLITKRDWKNDVPHDFYAAIQMANYIDNPQLEEAKRKLREAQSFRNSTKDRADALTTGVLGKIKPWVSFDKEKVYVSIKVELQFLVRRFKDDRNEMIHGGFASYNKRWKSNIYLSAVIALYKLMKRLDVIYAESNHVGD